MVTPATAVEGPQRGGHERTSPIDACFDFLTSRTPTIPEERLMLAVLLDAIIQLQRRGTTSAAASASWIRGDEGMTDTASISAPRGRSGVASVMLLLHAVALAPWWLRLAIVGMVPIAIVALSVVLP